MRVILPTVESRENGRGEDRGDGMKRGIGQEEDGLGKISTVDRGKGSVGLDYGGVSVADTGRNWVYEDNNAHSQAHAHAHMHARANMHQIHASSTSISPQKASPPEE